MADKYASLSKSIYDVFATSAWTAENITTYPENFTGTATEYIRVAILASRESNDQRLGSVAGQMIIDIFIPAGGGTSRTSQIADKLDQYLVGKTLPVSGKGNTQFGDSNLINLGIDKDNTSLYRSSYSIPFNYFGV